MSPPGAPDRWDDRGARLLARGRWRPSVVRQARLDLPGNAGAGARARAEIAEQLGPLIDAAELRCLHLVISELVTNAVVHGRAGDEHHVIVHLAVAPECIRGEVCDSGPGLDRQALPLAGGEDGGFGLIVVSRATSRWGASSAGGACVWFELDRRI